MSIWHQERMKKLRRGKTTYFKSVGMGLFDVCIAQNIRTGKGGEVIMK